MHRKIKHFYIEGSVSEPGMVRLRQTHDHLVFQHMEDKGYVPVLTLGPYLSLVFDFEKEVYNYVISAYGVFVGSEGVKQWQAIDPYTGALLPQSTQPSTLSTS